MESFKKYSQLGDRVKLGRVELARIEFTGVEIDRICTRNINTEINRSEAKNKIDAENFFI